MPPEGSDGRVKPHQGADKKPGYPRRVSLCDAEPGESVMLVHFEPQPALTPYRASHAIYVREDARQADLEPGVVPEMLRMRLLSVRAFDEGRCGAFHHSEARVDSPTQHTSA
jgi:hypothetical protein